MNIFRKLRWKLTLSYTLVTLGAFLVILLIMAGLVLTQIFVPSNSLNPEELITRYERPQERLFQQLLIVE
jgi:hypothetical protein